MSDDEARELYELENKIDAMANRIGDLESILTHLGIFLRKSDLPYRVVAPWVEAIDQKIERELSSYRV
jgi:hypothetical protein